jgi:hydrogenase nickel incorporation protein HypA/HybF
VHEIGYCEGVLEVVERRANGRRVARIGVRMGTVHRIEPDAFEQSFQLVAAGGVADGATTSVVTVPVQATCRACGNRFESPDPAPACPQCGDPLPATEGGDDVVLEWIEYQEDGHVPGNSG